jgi:O-antigen/teichoic acid export membrane protein
MIARKSFLIIIVQFLTRTLGWVGLITLAKLWGSYARDALGVIGFAMAFVGVFNIVTDLGFGQAHVKRISEGKDLGACMGTFFAIKMILTTIMVTIVLLAIFLLNNVFHQGFSDATTQSVVLVFLLYYVLLSFQQIATYTFNGTGEMAKMQITTVFENIFKVPLTILVALAGVSAIGLAALINWPGFLLPLQRFLASHPAGSLAMAYAFGMLVTVLVGFWLLRKYPWKKPDVALGKSYFLFALPMFLFLIISTISTNIDKLTIGYFWTNKEVGDYFSLQQILQIILIISVAFNTVLLPVYSEYHSQKNFKKINMTTHMVERYISMVVIPPIVIIILFVKPVINIMLNSSFLPASSTLIALSFYAVLVSFMAPFNSLIIGINRPGTYAKIGAIICLITITLDFVLVPRAGLLAPIGINGPLGAAVALVTANAVGFILIRLAAKRLTGIKLTQTHTPRHLIAGGVMALGLYPFTILITTFRWYMILTFAFLGLAIYLAVLYILREFKKQDFKFFLNLLYPKEMVGYIKSEFNENNHPKEKK